MERSPSGIFDGLSFFNPIKKARYPKCFGIPRFLSGIYRYALMMAWVPRSPCPCSCMRS